MQLNVRLLICLLLSALAALGTWFWYLTKAPFNQADFGSFTGTLRSAKEEPTGKSVYLEFYLVESPIRFRVPTDGYTQSFKRQDFFANVRPGMTVTLQAEQAQLDNPWSPPLDPVPTVFVHGLRDASMAYCTLDGRKEWEENNRFYGLLIAIFLTAVAAFFAVAFARTVPGGVTLVE